MGFCLSLSYFLVFFSCLTLSLFLVKEEIKPVETIRSLKLRSL